MGLDVNLCTDNYNPFNFAEWAKEDFNDTFQSSTFLYFLWRKDEIKHTPELNQIGKITQLDIEPIYEMLEYAGISSYLDDQQEFYDDEAFPNEYKPNKENIDKLELRYTKCRNKIENNIDKVYKLVSDIISRLEKIDNLSILLEQTDNDTLNNSYYFSDFKIDKGGWVHDSNFGRDMRVFKRFLEFAKSKNEKTVYFQIG